MRPSAAAEALANLSVRNAPIVEVERALDIVAVDVDLRDVGGFEGMLLANAVRSRGGVIADTSEGKRRARFTVAQDLGHFLIE